MPGAFILKFWHGVPSVDSWRALFNREDIVRKLRQNEFDEANKVIDGVFDGVRFNVTIR